MKLPAKLTVSCSAQVKPWTGHYLGCPYASLPGVFTSPVSACVVHTLPGNRQYFLRDPKHELTRLHICVFTCLVSAFVQSWIILNQRSVSSTITHFIGLTWLLSPLMCRRAPINYNRKFINLNVYMFINVYSLFIYLSPHKNYTQTVVSLQLVYHCEQQPLSVTGSLQVTVLLTYLSPLYCCTFSSA